MTREGTPHGRRLLVTSPAPRMDVARGFAVTGDAEELLRRFEEEPHTEPVSLGEHVESVRVLRWRLDPAVAEVSAPELLVLEGSVARTPAGSVLVDSRQAEVLLRFRERGRRLELSFRRGDVSLFAVGLLRSDLPAFEPRVAFAGGELSAWLLEHMRELEHDEGALGVVAAAGALVRFAGPHPDDDPSTGPPVSVRGARAWARSLDDAAWDTLEASALEHARDLDTRLPTDDGLPLALSRDLLASVSTAMRLAGRGGALRELLRETDRKAQVALTRLTEETPTTDDPRLRAVAWGEPEAWWGALAR